MKTIDVLSQIKYWTLALSVCFCLPALSQELTHRPFLEEGKVWKQRLLNSATPDTEVIFESKVQGDTLVNGLRCKKMYTDGQSRPEIYYEEGSKVYVIENGAKVLRMDLGLAVGDRSTADGDPYEAVSLDTLSMKGHLYRCVGISPRNTTESDVFPTDYLIEGIGSASGIKPQLQVASKVLKLLSVTVDGDEIYKVEDDFKPSAIKEVGEPSVRPASSAIYNLRGQRLSTAPQHGVYIQDGKKMAR